MGSRDLSPFSNPENPDCYGLKEAVMDWTSGFGAQIREVRYRGGRLDPMSRFGGNAFPCGNASHATGRVVEAVGKSELIASAVELTRRHGEVNGLTIDPMLKSRGFLVNKVSGFRDCLFS